MAKNPKRSGQWRTQLAPNWLIARAILARSSDDANCKGTGVESIATSMPWRSMAANESSGDHLGRASPPTRSTPAAASADVRSGANIWWCTSMMGSCRFHHTLVTAR